MMRPCVASRLRRMRSASTVRPCASVTACAKAPAVSTKICGSASISLCHGPVPRSWSSAIAANSSGSSAWTPRDAARIYSLAIGLRFCGMVLEPPRPTWCGSLTSAISLCISRITSVATLARLPQTKPRKAAVSTMRSRLTCQGDAGAASPSSLASPSVTAAFLAERGERAGSAGKLHGQHAPTQFVEPRQMIDERREPNRAFVAEGHRQRVLQVRPPRHYRAAMSLRLLGKSARASGDVALDDGESLAHLQHHGSVHDVLSGCAPMNVARRLLAGGAAERLGDAYDRIAHVARIGAELGQIDAVDRGGRRDGLGGALRDDAELGLRPRQRGLDIEHPLHELPVDEDAAHLVAAEERAKDL